MYAIRSYYGWGSLIWSGIFDKNERLVPDSPVPVVKTDLKSLNPKTDAVVWLGHSSWFIQANGRRILVDPVFSDIAAPFSFLNKAFAGTSVYQVEDMPEIDCLLISHDHRITSYNVCYTKLLRVPFMDFFLGIVPILKISTDAQRTNHLFDLGLKRCNRRIV